MGQPSSRMIEQGKELALWYDGGKKNQPSIQILFQFFQQTVGSGFIPHIIELLEDLPQNLSGKSVVFKNYIRNMIQEFFLRFV